MNLEQTNAFVELAKKMVTVDMRPMEKKIFLMEADKHPLVQRIAAIMESVYNRGELNIESAAYTDGFYEGRADLLHIIKSHGLIVKQSGEAVLDEITGFAAPAGKYLDSSGSLRDDPFSSTSLSDNAAILAKLHLLNQTVSRINGTINILRQVCPHQWEWSADEHQYVCNACLSRTDRI